MKGSANVFNRRSAVIKDAAPPEHKAAIAGRAFSLLQ
jgi:hypothetical protein